MNLALQEPENDGLLGGLELSEADGGLAVARAMMISSPCSARATSLERLVLASKMLTMGMGRPLA
jgi:hypothetical protein